MSERWRRTLGSKHDLDFRNLKVRPSAGKTDSMIRGVLVGVSPSDPVTLVAVALGLVLVAMATCYVPARRALRIEPAQLLRQE